MAKETFNTAIFTLADNLGFILQGVLLTLGFLYFHRYRRLDAKLLQLSVALCLILETISTGFNLSYGWKAFNDGVSAFRWEPPFAMVVRIPVMAISQTYFFIRAWRLFSKPYWIAVAWAIAVSAEVATGEADFLVTVFQRTAANTKPHSTIDLLTSHLVVVAALDLTVAVSFVLKLRSMKSSMKRSDAVIRQILIQTIIVNSCFFILALAVLLTWVLVLSAKYYKIPMELGYRSYAISFLATLLSRESVRSQLQSPFMSLQFPIDLNSDQTDRIQSPRFEARSQIQRWSGRDSTPHHRNQIKSKSQSQNIDEEESSGTDPKKTSLENDDSSERFSTSSNTKISEKMLSSVEEDYKIGNPLKTRTWSNSAFDLLRPNRLEPDNVRLSYSQSSPQLPSEEFSYDLENFLQSITSDTNPNLNSTIPSTPPKFPAQPLPSKTKLYSANNPT